VVDIEEDVRLEGMDEYIRQTSLNRYPQSKIQVNYLSNIVSIVIKKFSYRSNS